MDDRDRERAFGEPMGETYDLLQPVKLSEQELSLKRDELAHRVREYASTEDEKKAAMATFTQKLKSTRANIDRVAGEIRSRSVERNVPCRNYALWNQGLVETRRLDTGEVIDRRPMDTRERQMALEHADGFN